MRCLATAAAFLTRELPFEGRRARRGVSHVGSRRGAVGQEEKTRRRPGWSAGQAPGDETPNLPALQRQRPQHRRRAARGEARPVIFGPSI